MNTNKKTARVFGIFFILAYATYIVGNVLTQSLVNSPTSLSNVYEHKNQLALGVILMTIVETVFNMGFAIIIFTKLKNWNKNIAYSFFCAAIMATLLLIVGGIFIILTVPLSEEYAKNGFVSTPSLQQLSILLYKGNYYTYQIAMSIWGIAGFLLSYLLFVSKIVPRYIAVWGFIGYFVFTSGTFFVLFGFSENVGIVMDIPGGLFELYLSIWVIVKGFRTVESPQN